ncbi:hypothetical protein ACH47B_06565 [Rhodococcus sp. NPDC019627]|uniref:hypothetical protein n=1 Tax=unclassified Rhodococcus (in: high G+C Gram-positive bacteria) TaxID=192944 RepID=UPI0037A29061
MTLTGADVVTAGQGRFDDVVEAGRVLDRVWEAVRSYCGWHIAPVLEGVELVVDGTGRRTLQLPSLRVVNVVAVAEDGVELDPTSFTWSRAGMLRKRVGCWTSEFQGIVATVDHGRDAAPDVEGVVLQTAVRAMTAPGGQIGLRVGQIDERWATTVGGFGFFASDFEILDNHRITGSG